MGLVSRGMAGLGRLIADRSGGAEGTGPEELPEPPSARFPGRSDLSASFEEEAGFLSGLSRFDQAAGDLDRGYRRTGHLPVRADEPDFIANGHGSFVHPAATTTPLQGWYRLCWLRNGIHALYPFLSSADDLT